MADSFRDQSLRPLPPHIYREALRLGATARLDDGDYAWILMAAAAMITHSPALKTVARPRLLSWAEIALTAVILTLALLAAAWVGAHGWTGYLADQIEGLEARREQMTLDAPPEWATRWTHDATSGQTTLFAAAVPPEAIVVVPCSLGATRGSCIGIDD